MCLIVTIIMLVLSIQNLMQHQWFTGTVQLIIALGFLLLLIRNIRDKQDVIETEVVIRGVSSRTG